MKRSRGFTLVELLVAIVVMSMLALLSWRSIDGMTRTAIEGAFVDEETRARLLARL